MPSSGFFILLYSAFSIGCAIVLWRMSFHVQDEEEIWPELGRERMRSLALPLGRSRFRYNSRELPVPTAMTIRNLAPGVQYQMGPNKSPYRRDLTYITAADHEGGISSWSH